MRRSRSRILEIDRTDLESLLGKLAGALRNEGLALTGLGQTHWSSGSREVEDLDAMVGSLERTAGLLEGISANLCPACGLKEVSERVVFGSGVPPARTRKNGKPRKASR